MKNQDLINNLTMDLRPVKVFKLKWQHYATCLAVGLFTTLAGLAISGVRFDLLETMKSAQFIIESLILIVLALASTAIALRLSIPHKQSQKTKYFVLTTLGVWFLVLLFFLLRSNAPMAGWGFTCLSQVLLGSVFPAAVIFFIANQAAPLSRALTGWVVLTSGTAFGALVAHFSCSMSNPLHLLVWHALPVVVIGVLGVFIGKLFLVKI